MTPRNEATERQVQAARPNASTWLAANAGSGKTRVLTDRVARLLLSDVQPQHILCLTYTKAAASEMQNRLFKRLGKWAMLDDVELWNVGTLVRHPVRGLGRIMSIHRGSKRTHVTVRFQGGSEQTWVLEFAKLERVDFDEVGDIDMPEC